LEEEEDRGKVNGRKATTTTTTEKKKKKNRNARKNLRFDPPRTRRGRRLLFFSSSSSSFFPLFLFVARELTKRPAARKREREREGGPFVMRVFSRVSFEEEEVFCLFTGMCCKR